MPTVQPTPSERNYKIIGKNQVMELTGLSNPTIWRMEKRGDFPSRIQIGARRVGWHEREVLQWIESRPRPLDIQLGR